MTTLLQLYMRAAAIIIPLLVIAFLAALALVSPAFAQDAAPAAPEATTKDFIDLVFSSAAAGAMSLGAIVMAFLARSLPSWLTPILDFITTREASHWEELTTAALDRAEAYARTKYDALKDRAGYVNAMATFLAMFNREIVQFADKNGNGIIDLIETRLPPDTSGKKPPAAPEVQAFVGTPRRGVKAREAVN